jgi:hypothetical protein
VSFYGIERECEICHDKYVIPEGVRHRCKELGSGATRVLRLARIVNNAARPYNMTPADALAVAEAIVREQL